MAKREVSLFLKYPGPSYALQRLQHSLLECVVEHKSGTESEFMTKSPAQLKSQYQLKGTASLVDDEIIVQFAPRHKGLHTIRIFSDTRELCRPLAVIVNREYEVESTPIDQPVNMTIISKLVHTSNAPEAAQQHTQRPQSSAFPQGGGFPPSRSQSAVPPDSGSSPQHNYIEPQQQQVDYGHIRGFTSDPSLTQPDTRPLTQYLNPPLPPGAGTAAQRYSFVSSGGGRSRPMSMSPEESTFAGDLFTSRPEKTTFEHLHASKKMYGVRNNPLSLDHENILTADRFRRLQREADLAVRGKAMKSKRRCGICSKKTKASKSVHLGEEDFCENCFRRQYLLRSAIEHFMVPTIQECTVEVPVNKKATKFVSTRKTIANANLRGLEPVDIRYAQEEFRKFDMENSGWISKAVLLPLLKACLTYSTHEKHIKVLLSGQALQSVVKSYGLDEREEVHEIEFLCLLAFVARERHRLIGSHRGQSHNTTKFTASDLEMAYAFRNQFNRAAPVQPAAVNPLHTGPTAARVSTSPSHYTQFSSPEHQTSPAHRQDGQGFLSDYFPRSPTDGELNEVRMSAPGFSPSNSMQFASPAGISRPKAVPGNPLFSGPTHNVRNSASMGDFQTPQRFPLQQNPAESFSRPQSQYDYTQPPSRRVPQSSFGDDRGQGADESAFTDASHMLGLGGGGGVGELPEVDQDLEEPELPQIPPSKDPSGQTITNTLLTRGKNKSSPKQMMEELKLTGGTADSWMMY